LERGAFYLAIPEALSLNPTRPVKSKSTLSYERRSVGQCLLVTCRHLGPMANFSVLFFFFRQLRFCYHGEPSMTKKRICRLQLQLGFTSAVFLGSDSCETHDKFYCLKFETPSIWKAMFPYLFLPGICQTVTTQGTGFV
jgi:hypothetical protein